MRTKIQNIEELRAEMEFLGLKRVEMEKDLKIEAQKLTAKIAAPLLLFKKINEFLGFGKETAEKKDDGDWMSSIFQIGLPLLMNRFIYPKSGTFMKTIIGLVTQNVAKSINKDFMIKVVEKISEWVKTQSDKLKKKPEMADYGIPPDSETY
jgi:hypothetical protein